MLRRLHFTLALAMTLLVSCRQETAYVFTYFDNSQQDAGLFLAYSYDGFHWTSYNDNQPVMRSKVGYNNILRDPSVCQGPDGVFHLVWTVSWNAKSIGHAWSTDLVHWNDQKAVPVMEAFPSTRNTWAPELFYSKAEDLFYIFWASTVPDNPEVSTEGSISENQYNHRIYCTTTRDFDTFSPTRLYFNPAFNAIDAAVVQVPGKEEFIMAVKNENLHPAEKNIRLTRSTSMKEGFPTEVSAPVSGIGMGDDAWAEGPSPLYIGKDLIVFYDLYRQHRYGASISHDNGVTWEDATPLIHMPVGMSHGTAIPVAKEYVDALVASGRHLSGRTGMALPQGSAACRQTHVGIPLLAQGAEALEGYPLRPLSPLLRGALLRYGYVICRRRHLSWRSPGRIFRTKSNFQQLPSLADNRLYYSDSGSSMIA